MTTQDLVLQVEDIYKSFGSVQALDGVDLAIGKGEVHTLIGENGSGKSTLVKIISGVYEKDQGELFIRGERYSSHSPLVAMRKGIHVIYQDLSLVPTFSVAKNIALPMEIAKNKRFLRNSEMKNRAKEALTQVGLDLSLSEKVENLDIADRQLVAIARASLRDAQLIIMDEPTASLTREEVEKLFSVINELRDSGVSILFISHQLNEVLNISDRITIIRDGINVIEGPVEDFDPESLEYYMTGRKPAQKQSFQSEEGAGEVLLELEEFTRKGELEDINLKVKAGEILGITGLLGSGRNDLALSLFGIKPPDLGQMMVNGEKIAITSPKQAYDNGITYVPKDRLTRGLALEKSVEDNLVSSVIEKLLNKFNLVDRDKKVNESDKWIRELNIKTESREAATINLSGGNQQRVVLGKSLAVAPDILVLNTPTFGIDVGTTEAIHEMLKRLASEERKAIILISDDISELVSNSSRILLMRNGQIAKRFNKDEINKEMLYEHLIGDVKRA